jgi:hypothetical protein
VTALALVVSTSGYAELIMPVLKVGEGHTFTRGQLPGATVTCVGGGSRIAQTVPSTATTKEGHWSSNRSNDRLSLAIAGEADGSFAVACQRCNGWGTALSGVPCGPMDNYADSGGVFVPTKAHPYP